MAMPYIYKLHITLTTTPQEIISYTTLHKLTFLDGESVGHVYHHFLAISQVKTDIPRTKHWNVIPLIKYKDCWACRDYILLRLTEINVVLSNTCGS